MKHTRMTTWLRRSALALVLLGLATGTTFAATYNLVADEFTKTMPDGAVVPMWGFATDTGQACGAGGAWDLGPALFVDLAGMDPTLTVNLRNCLPEPVSIVIPGQPGALAPQTVVDPQGRTRVRAFVNEAAALTGTAAGTAVYTWADLNPGAYLYMSGSHVARQVQMGLYSAVFVDVNSTTGEVYPGVLADSWVVMLYSEVDPALHDPPATATPLAFKPKYFLVNGEADGYASLQHPLVNDQVLVRFINAGLKEYAPTLLGGYLQFVAEDGNPYPYPRTSYGSLLPPGKTLDAIWVPTTSGDHPVFDRRLHLSTNGAPGGGLLATVSVDAVGDLPFASAGPDQTHVAMFTGGQPTVVHLNGGGSSPSAVNYSWTLTSAPTGSAATLVPDPGDASNPTRVSFTLDVPGSYVAQLVVTSGTGTSAPDTVTVLTNLPPVAVAGANLSVFTREPVTLDGSESHDPDSDPIAAYSWSFVSWPGGNRPTLEGANTASPRFTPTAAGEYHLSLVVNDFELASETSTVVITASDRTASPPTAVEDYATVVRNTSGVFINLVANDSDPDGDLDPNSIIIVTPPRVQGSTVRPVRNGVLYTPKRNFRGTDDFKYVVKDSRGNTSNDATVVVNVVRQ